jgi:hypothetical protein
MIWVTTHLGKKMKISIIFFCLFYGLFAEASLTINLFSQKNGKGLEASRQILKNDLVELGHLVYERDANEGKCKNCPQADLNIFFQIINPAWLDSAGVNWFIPNPEWYRQDRLLLNHIDLILCRTHEVERIFNALNKRTYYIGFTSHDCLNTAYEKDYTRCLHVAGGSHHKGTQAIVKAWSGRGDLNNLTVLVHYFVPHRVQPNVQWINEKLSEPDLRIFQNCCGIHLCPSETEGFGHYLMEAMSTGAVVITTDGPPMNEYIEDKRCLVPYTHISPCRLASRYLVDPEQLTQCIEELMALSTEELKKIGDLNRANYLQRTKEFHLNLKRLIEIEFP